MDTVAERDPLLDSEQIELLRDALGDEELLRMLSQLPAAASDTLQRIRECLAAADLAETRKAAHVLKGFSSSLGAARLSAIACEIELDLATLADVEARMPSLSETIEATVAAVAAMQERS
ncbi:Hpt domain-containing protein [Bradyrhizobium sp. HKCCYLS2038]|uniref:Hpt domain-containing protein n=1 Tax=unclassified Bradyrhizobium TaxID=2631580 RepID=UPI003EB86B1F